METISAKSNKENQPPRQLGGETRMRISYLPLIVTTKDLWEIFSTDGEISNIEIFRDGRGNRTSEGRVIFSSPVRPELLNSTGRSYTVRIPSRNDREVDLRLHFESDSVNEQVLPRTLSIRARSISFATLCTPNMAKLMETVYELPKVPILLTQENQHRRLEITFPLVLNSTCTNLFKISIAYSSPIAVWEISKPTGSTQQRTLILSLAHVPELFVKNPECDTHDFKDCKWSKQRAWDRKTEILHDMCGLKNPPTSLLKPNARINIAHWKVYRLEFDLSDMRIADSYAKFCTTLENFNIHVLKGDAIQFGFDDSESVIDFIGDGSIASPSSGPSGALADLTGFSMIRLPFRVRYQLEMCLSEGYLNEFNIPREFVETLQSLDEDQAVSVLEKISDKAKQIANPMDFLHKDASRLTLHKRKIPQDYALIYSALITPTTIHFCAPSIEISNRVMRHYSQCNDRFLRVKFVEEKPNGKIFPKPADSKGRTVMDEVFERIENTLRNGIVIGDRHYEFLGYGNSQFRENGAYFFAPDEYQNAARIRAWMGDFSHITSVSKYAARIGQCFSTTRPVRGAGALVLEADDIHSVDRKYLFTDGVGRISKPMAQLAALEMGIHTPDGQPPSVIQFRAGGAKGVLAVHETKNNSDENKKLAIWVRPSQYKFHANTERLEIIRWSRFSPAYLNRQLILVLSTLGVPDAIFVSMMKAQLHKLDAAMEDEDAALDLLQREVDPSQVTSIMASLIRDGFHMTREPFIVSLLHLWRAFSIKYLKEKAKILVRSGAVLLGCVDEYGVLQGHFNALQPKSKIASIEACSQSLPEIFVQLSKGKRGKPEVIKGYMLLARNPALHPGDIRVVKGVDYPELRHLKDVVVLPQTGNRDLGSMCSGGDLDGDDYLVLWDKELLPDHGSWNYPPMDYSALPEIKAEGGVHIHHVTQFFVNYMKNNSLAQIALAHTAIADKSPDGVKDPKCLKLASLHSQAVDYPKSGHAVQMSPDLGPRVWPHFMNRRNVYRSKKILGQLYDLVERVDFVPKCGMPFDSRILRKYEITNDTLASASSIKRDYDASLRRIMAQHDIRTEFEVWSTFVMAHSERDRGYKFQEVIADLSSALKDTYREECYRAAGGKNLENIAPFVAAMYVATADEVSNYMESNPEPTPSENGIETPLISFPWLFHSILGNIANNDAQVVQSLNQSMHMHGLNTASTEMKLDGGTPVDQPIERVAAKSQDQNASTQPIDPGASFDGANDANKSKASPVLHEQTKESSETVAKEPSMTGRSTNDVSEEMCDLLETEVLLPDLQPASLLQQLADQ